MEWEFSLTNYNSDWRRCRRSFHDYFNQTAVQEYRSVHRRVVRMFLNNLLEDPDNFRVYIKR